MSEPERPTPSRGLADELQRTFRTLLAGLLLVAAVLGALSWLLLGSIQPDLRYDTDLIRTLRLNHEAMLDQQGGLQGWLATGDPSDLATGREGEAVASATSAELLDALGRQPDIDRAILELELASRAWADHWARPSSQLDPVDLDGTELSEVFASGRTEFDAYRRVQEAATGLAARERDDAMARMQRALSLGFAGVVGIVVIVSLMLTRQRRHLQRRLEAPIRSLLEGMEAIQRNEPTRLLELRGPHEFVTLAQHLHHTSSQVRSQHRALEEQQADSEAAAATLGSILTVAREIAGSLSVRYVAETVADAAATMTPCDRSVVWLTSDGCEFVAVHDSSLGHGVVPATLPLPIGSGAIGVVARDARAQVVDGSACFPLVVGGRVIGVLELVGSMSPGATAQRSLETLATHAAAALEAARLHRATEELAQVDALTQLFNRRRLDDDLTAELDRANRYGRPVGFVLLDLDRFKVLNDTFGHQHGDEVLRLTGECLTEGIRSSDTVYRYGGEEFAVLVREGTRAACLELAERLRVELARTFTDRAGFTEVTASFGVALAPDHGRTAAELIGAADVALYTAKAEGRNRVVLAALGDHAQLPGDPTVTSTELETLTVPLGP